jgi:hypothetical protein
MTKVYGVMVEGHDDMIGREYQWSLETVLNEDTPDEVSTVQRLLDEYEVEDG